MGSIDDILLSDNEHKAGTIVVSVGGFLGMGSKLVSVPFDQIRIENDKVVTPGATKASLEVTPEYLHQCVMILGRRYRADITPKFGLIAPSAVRGLDRRTPSGAASNCRSRIGHAKQLNSG